MVERDQPDPVLPGLGGIGLAMSATLYDPAFATATRWFERKRLRALTVITLVAGFASTIFLPLAQWLVEHQTWRPSR
jgi:MFS family permease